MLVWFLYNETIIKMYLQADVLFFPKWEWQNFILEIVVAYFTEMIAPETEIVHMMFEHLCFSRLPKVFYKMSVN